MRQIITATVMSSARRSKMYLMNNLHLSASDLLLHNNIDETFIA